MNELIIDSFAGGGGLNSVAVRFHGLSYTAEYRAWQTMRLRCINPENAAYENYGARGIKVCDRWMSSPQSFVDDMGLKPSPDHELDRIDNDGNYEPGNCRWALRTTQARNRRSNRYVEYAGDRLTIAEWSEKANIRSDTLRYRLNQGWTPEEALSIPVQFKSPKGFTADRTKLCSDCHENRTLGKRCRSCENRRRWRAQRAQDPTSIRFTASSASTVSVDETVVA